MVVGRGEESGRDAAVVVVQVGGGVGVVVVGVVLAWVSGGGVVVLIMGGRGGGRGRGGVVMVGVVVTGYSPVMGIRRVGGQEGGGGQVRGIPRHLRVRVPMQVQNLRRPTRLKLRPSTDAATPTDPYAVVRGTLQTSLHDVGGALPVW